MSSISNSLSSLFSPVSVEPSTSTVSSSGNSSSTSNSNSTGTSSSTPASGFVGTSQYSSELQSEVSREVEIAELPIEELSNQQSTLSSESNEMTTIGGLVSSLQSAIQGIQTAIDPSSDSTTITDSEGNVSTAVTATLSDNAQEGVYSMTVNSVGAYASGITSSNWSPPSNSSSYNLLINGKGYAITSSNNSASGIAAAINQEYGNQVEATVVNLSPTDTRIALQSTSLGPETLDLQDSHKNSLFTQNVGGTQAEYTVTGGQPVYTDSPSVEISPGVTLTMNAATTGPVDVTVSPSVSALSSALSSFATAYNAAVDAITSQHGQSAGPLQGNSVLQAVSNSLNQIGLFSDATGSVTSLANLGLELNANSQMNGHLTFTSLNLASTEISDPADVSAFLENSTSGGFLEMATNLLNNLTDPATGLLTNAESNLQTQINGIGTTIATKQAQVSQLQTTLTNQMSQADALIAETEQQFTYMDEMFQAQQTELQTYAGV